MKKNTPIQFVIPDPDAFQSGGNIYNRNLILGLRKKDYAVEIVDFQGFTNSFDSNVEKIYFFDTLFADEILQKSFPKKENNSDEKKHRFFLIVHHLESLFPSENFIEKNEKALLEKMDGFLVTSDFTKVYLESKGFQKHLIWVVPPAFQKPTNISKRDLSKVDVLIVANWIKRKGIYEFLFFLEKKLRHLREVSEGKIDFSKQLKITIVGSKIIEKKYAQKCLDFILKNEIFEGVIICEKEQPSQAVISFYKKSNVLVSPAYMETFGMALQEAAAFGLPILAFDGGNAKFHVEEGKNGFLFSSHETLVDTLLEITENTNILQRITDYALLKSQTNDYNWEDATELFLHHL